MVITQSRRLLKFMKSISIGGRRFLYLACLYGLFRDFILILVWLPDPVQGLTAAVLCMTMAARIFSSLPTWGSSTPVAVKMNG